MAIRVITLGTKWNPATHRGQPIRQYFTLPISFSIDGVITPADSREFPKGYYEWMATNLRYPSLAKRLGLEGTVLLSFKVSKTGKVDSVQLLEDIGGNCGKEAVRVLKTVPREYSMLLGSRGERLYQPLHFRVADLTQVPEENNRPGVQELWPIVITTIGETARDPFGLMRGVAFRSFDEALARPRDVYRLDFARKNVSVVPPEIWRLEHLRLLDLEDNKIRSLPPEMGTLKKLAELQAAQNELKSLPIEFANLKALRILGLANNKFEEFPKPVLLLTRLKTLDLSGNQLTSLPIGIGDLQNLETLLIHNNHLTALPEQFYRLTQLKTLTVSGNNLGDKDKQMLIEKLKKTEIRFE